MENKNLQILKDYYESNNNKVNGMKLKKWFENEHPEIKIELENLLTKHQNLTNIANIAGCLIHNIPLNSFKCKVCGKELKIRNWTLKNTYCSTKCAMNDEDLQKRKAETIAKDPNYWKNRQEKITKTNLKRYGTKTPAENKEIAKKMIDTCAKDPDHWKKRNEKSKQTCLEKYGVENAYNIEKVKNKSLMTRREKLFNSFNSFKDKWVPLFSLNEFKKVNIKTEFLKYFCKECNNEFSYCFGDKKILINSLLPKNIPSCPNCNNYKHGQSKNEIDVLKFIEHNYKGEILVNTKKFTNPYELDIVIPEKNLAIEFNGNYWHSLQVRPNKFYHLNKTKLCEKSNLNLFHIFEFDWIDKIKQNIIKNMILERLDIIKHIKNNEIKILNDIDKKICIEFIKLNSLHEFHEYDKSIGLFDKNNLISLICLNKENEIVNYATSIPIINDLKLLIDNLKVEKLKIKVNYAYDNIKKIKDTGFILKEESEPNLINFHHKNNKQYQLYDCGNLVFEKIFK